MAIVILVALFALMYFLFIRPQQKKMREHRELLNNVEVGDEVLTTSGMYGVITEFDGDTVFLEVSDGVSVKISKESIGAIIEYIGNDDEDESVDG